jgi:hypothetical protein
MTKRPLNGCGYCGYTWYPRGNDRSLNCPKCGAARVSDAPSYVSDWKDVTSSRDLPIVIQVEASAPKKRQLSISYRSISIGFLALTALLFIGNAVHDKPAPNSSSTATSTAGDTNHLAAASSVSMPARNSCGDPYNPQTVEDGSTVIWIQHQIWCNYSKQMPRQRPECEQWLPLDIEEVV